MKLHNCRGNPNLNLSHRFGVRLDRNNLPLKTERGFPITYCVPNYPNPTTLRCFLLRMAPLALSKLKNFNNALNPSPLSRQKNGGFSGTAKGCRAIAARIEQLLTDVDKTQIFTSRKRDGLS